MTLIRRSVPTHHMNMPAKILELATEGSEHTLGNNSRLAEANSRAARVCWPPRCCPDSPAFDAMPGINSAGRKTRFHWSAATRPDRDHGTRGISHYEFGDGTQTDVTPSPVTVGGHDDQVRIEGLGEGRNCQSRFSQNNLPSRSYSDGHKFPKVIRQFASGRFTPFVLRRHGGRHGQMGIENRWRKGRDDV